MAKANGWNLRWHCQLHDMKIGQNHSQVPNDFPIFFLFDQMNPKRDTNKGFFFFNNTMEILWQSDFSNYWEQFLVFNQLMLLSLSLKKNENFPSEQVSYFLK